MEILATLGPSTFNSKSIGRLTELGVNLFRINLSHTKFEDLEKLVNTIRSSTEVPICLDTEGAQVRTGDLEEFSYTLNDFDKITFYRDEFIGNATKMNLTPSYIFEQFEVGDMLSIDFNSVLVQVEEIEDGALHCRVLNGGVVGRNKAVTVIGKKIKLNPLSEKDVKCLELGRSMGIKNVALSFANFSEDVIEIRKHCSEGTRVISKIECINGLQNLEGITTESDAILIDRGDLSREVEIESIPYWQKHIIGCAKKLNTKVYVATNLLESMIHSPSPTRAEVNDIFNTLNDGASGLVLAAETAIGKYPTQCVEMVKKVIHTFNCSKSGAELDVNYSYNTVAPHGGKLVQNFASSEEMNAMKDYKEVTVRDTDILDCEQIAEGTYSPLTGFMNEEVLNSVLDSMKLPNGTTWTMPIILQVDKDKANSMSVGETVALCAENGTAYSLLKVNQIYTLNHESVCEKWFGTADDNHPGVARVKTSGDYVIGGEVKLIKRFDKYNSDYYLSPSQSRLLFDKKGWSKVVGFHTRNVVHRAHEFIQLKGLEIGKADGIFITPVAGPKKKGDFVINPILNAYQMIIKNGAYPEGKAVLGSFKTFSRYSGPREAVFTAICRKNMGCSHFIIGRDHTGVGNYYQPDANMKLFEELGDIGITPLFFDEVAYCDDDKEYQFVTVDKNFKRISGTEVRNQLVNGERLPNWFIREEVQNMLLEKIKHNEQVFW